MLSGVLPAQDAQQRERDVTEGDVGANPVLSPVKDRAHAERVLEPPEALLDPPKLGIMRPDL